MQKIFRNFLAFNLLMASGLATAADIVVRSGQAIQDAVTAAKPGDTILVEPGIYKETVYIDKDNVTLRGVCGLVVNRKKVLPISPLSHHGNRSFWRVS